MKLAKLLAEANKKAEDVNKNSYKIENYKMHEFVRKDTDALEQKSYSLKLHELKCITLRTLIVVLVRLFIFDRISSRYALIRSRSIHKRSDFERSFLRTGS